MKRKIILILIIFSFIKGKTTLTLNPTLGIENFINNYKLTDGTAVNVKIYDTAGQEKYRSLTTSVIKLNEGFLLVFSVDDRSTFERINNWIEDISQIVSLDEKIIFLVGNKIDKPIREVKYEEAEKFANENGMKYFETSAMTGEGIK